MRSLHLHLSVPTTKELLLFYEYWVSWQVLLSNYRWNDLEERVLRNAGQRITLEK